MIEKTYPCHGQSGLICKLGEIEQDPMHSYFLLSFLMDKAQFVFIFCGIDCERVVYLCMHLKMIHKYTTE